MQTEGDLIKINKWLLPLSWLYGMGVNVRNRLFEMDILKQRTFDIPVISVGNITVGGSGKTPHVEYLVRLLQDIVKVGVLSRGYKRKSRGYVLGTEESTTRELGDEPYQMKRKFENIYVAVDKDRCHGIDRMTADVETNDVDVILLDDAFQHRYVHPGINILLIDYHRFITYDKLLPAGRLREPVKSKDRADIVIVTKCPKELKPMNFRVLTKNLNIYPYQELFFSYIDYDIPQPVFADMAPPIAPDNKNPLAILHGRNVMVLTGIASPEQMQNDLKVHCRSMTPLAFGDHHNFTAKDAEKINAVFESMPSPKIIVTTEKDATRLLHLDTLADDVKAHLVALPIKVSFIQEQEEKFNHKIISYVRKNSRNSILVKRKDDNKSKDSNHTGNGSRTIIFRNH